MSSPEVHQVVRDTIRAVLGGSVAEWPADRPLAELPDALYDSLVQLEVLTRMERTLQLAPRPVDPAQLTTIDSIVAYVSTAAPGGLTGTGTGVGTGTGTGSGTGSRDMGQP